MISFRTETGSVYEVDDDTWHARRVSGAKGPTANMVTDGAWKPFIQHTVIVPGQPVLFVWGIETREDGMKLRQTCTSPVTEILPQTSE